MKDIPGLKTNTPIEVRVKDGMHIVGRYISAEINQLGEVLYNMMLINFRSITDKVGTDIYLSLISGGEFYMIPMEKIDYINVISSRQLTKALQKQKDAKVATTQVIIKRYKHPPVPYILPNDTEIMLDIKNIIN